MSSEEIVMDDIGQNRPFMCGVIEGFYGKPWTAEQRKELFTRMKRFGMDTYMYAPKDDYKHRLHWRDLYRGPEADDLRELIATALEFDIHFVYAISPGLDMTLSDAREVDLLKQKLAQVQSFGCECYALLFDDIEPELNAADSKVFRSTGEAQAKVTNEVYKYLDKPDVFLFCPTEYCRSRADPNLVKSVYLKTIGKVLHKDIHILWTGPKVVSHRITLESICELEEILRRPPTIWDNLHANDYDQTRLYLGPYDGRPQILKEHLRGVLTNPNCEFEVNYIGMHTLAQWSKNTIQRFPTLDADAMDVDPPKTGYQPQRALFCAIEDWIPEFYKPKGVRLSEKTLQMITGQNMAVSPHAQTSKPPADSSKSCDLDLESKSDEDNMEVVPTPCDSGDVKSPNSQIVNPPVDSKKKGKSSDDLDDLDDPVVTRDSDKEASVSDSRYNLFSKSDVGGTPMDTEKDVEGASKEVSSKLNNAGSGQDGVFKPLNDARCKIDDNDLLEMEDVLILCDLFYLPFEYGSRAVHLLKKGHWLVSNVERIKDIDKTKMTSAERPPEVREWYDNAIHFHDCFKEMVMMVDKLVKIPNRELLYELYNYVSDMRSALSLVNSYIKWNGLGKPEKEPFRGGEQEPWVHRGGIYGEFRRLLPIEGATDMFPAVEKQPPPQNVYIIRPYFSEDRPDVYSVCRKTCDDGLDGSDIFTKNPDLVADDSIGAMLQIHPEFCFVLEDEAGICGYAACVPNMKEFQQKLEDAWLVQMREKYPDPCPSKQDDLTVTEEIIKSFHNHQLPVSETLFKDFPSFIQLSILHGRADGLATTKRLLNCALKSLKSRGGGGGSKGVHTILHSSHLQLARCYDRLDFDDITEQCHLDKDLVVMGTRL